MAPARRLTGRSALVTALRHAWLRSRGSLSLALVSVCVGVFVLAALLDLLGLVTRHQFVTYFGLSYVGIFERGWVHQLLTGWFVHANVIHLLFNMLSLWMLGPSVEAAIGRRRYIFLSLAAIGSATVGTLLFTWGTGTIVVGYSSAIFGVLVAQALLFPDNIIVVFYFFPMKMKHAAILLATLALYFTISAEPGGTAHAAHLFGAVGAFLYLKGHRHVGVPRWLRGVWPKIATRAAIWKRRRRRKQHTETPWKL